MTAEITTCSLVGRPGSGWAWSGGSATGCSASPASSSRRPGRWGRADPGLLLLGPGGAGARPLPVGGGRCAAGSADRRRGGLDHAVLQLAVGHPGGDRLPAPVARPRPARVRGVRPSGGAALRRAGPVLAVRQRAEQHRPAVGRDGGRVRRAADHLLPRGQGRRPGRGGGARRVRVRRVQQRTGQRAPAVLRPPGGRGPGGVRPVQRAPVRRRRECARLSGPGPRVDAVARVPQAGRGRRARRAAAVRVW